MSKFSNPHSLHVHRTSTHICSNETEKIITQLQTEITSRLIEILIKVVKTTPDHMLMVLCHIFNLILSQEQKRFLSQVQ